jgi:oxygen-independent coproporphyrinogen-3 oxidase
VYTDKNARDIEVYLDALIKEVSLLAARPVVGDRPLHYV